MRATAISCLNTWVEQCNGMKEFFEGEVIADALKAGNPFVKADLLAWLAEKLPTGIIKFFFVCAENFALNL